MRPRRWVVAAAERVGYELHRHPARRRVQMMLHRRIDLVVDVGAAQGRYGEELRRGGYRGSIISFEPLSAAFAELQRRVGSDGDWDVRNVGLGERAGEAVINVAANSDSSSLLPMLPRHEVAAEEATYVGTETIRLTTLDEVLSEVAPSARVFVKLDVQGFERQVLAGAAASLGRIAGLQLELSLVPLYDGGMLYDEALAFTRQHGFVLCGLEPGFTDPATGDLLQADGIFFRA